MNLLHISDFHYFDENLVYEKVVSAIIDSVKREHLSIDCALFTGDLVYYGNRKNDFLKAKKVLFDRLINELGIPKNNIIICPGNHDIDRDSIYPTAENSFNTVYNTNEALNKLYHDQNQSYTDSISPSSNYKEFERGFYDLDSGDLITPLYSILFRSIHDVLYGFVCMNSAWLSALDKKGSKDRGNLLYPTDALKEAILKIKQKNCRKVLLIHHPLHFFREYNASEIEGLVLNSFDLMFSGHVHKAHSNSGHDGTNGLYVHVAKASLSHDESCQGCSIISLKDYDDNEVVVREITYIPDSNDCHIGNPIVHTIPAGEDKIKAIKFRNTIAEKYNIELENAHKLLLLNDDGVSSEFLSLFSFPNLRTRSDDAIGGQDVSDAFVEENLFSNHDNYLFLGRDKCGKTSLLRWIQISFLKGFSRYQIIPFYINCKEIEPRISDDKFNLIDEIRNYYSINKNKAVELVSSGSFVLLLDNYSDNSSAAFFFREFLNENEKCRFIVCAEYSASKPLSSYEISKHPYKGYYFQDLNRVDIVKYVEKRISRPEERDLVNEQIVRLCKQMQLPVNYWTVSLLLLIHKRSSDTYSQNIFQILDVCVDEIFGKKERALKGADIPFEKLKQICAYVAMRLFLDYKPRVFSASKSEIIGILNDYLVDDDRIDVQASDIFNFFYQSGILKVKTLGTDVYVFRHNGFFEYFLALRMTEDMDFKNRILNNPNLYLAFKNEWDIYSGIRRNDGDFLQTVFELTRKNVDSVLCIPSSNFDEVLIDKGRAFAKLEDQYKQLATDKPLSSAQKALIEDSVDSLELESDVKPVADYLTNGLTPDTVERFLFILGRVFRNSDGIPKQFKELKAMVFDFILKYYANFAFFSIDYIARQAEAALKEIDFDFTESQEKAILKMITDFSPLLSQAAMTDSIGHKSMAMIFKNKLTELNGEKGCNQFLLFLLVLVLSDVDIESNLPLVKQLMSVLTIPILKSMLYFKLNYYMAFKSGGKQQLQKELLGMIKDQRHKMDNTIKDSEQQKSIQESRKRSNTLAKKGRI